MWSILTQATTNQHTQLVANPIGLGGSNTSIGLPAPLPTEMV